MATSPAQSIPSANIDTKLLGRYLVFGAILAVMALIYALFNLPMRYLYLAAATPIALVIILNPRLALYQFVFVLFIEVAVFPSVPLLLIDISALLAIMAAVLDFLAGNRLPGRLPALTVNYVALVMVLVLTGLFGYWPHLAIRPVVRLMLLTATFLAVFHLAGKTSVTQLVKWYFVLAALHSLYVVSQFLAAGGQVRVFGLTRVVFDDQVMVALPIGVALFLWSSRKVAPFMLTGTLIVLGGLVATQSRAPIVMSLLGCLVISWVSVRRAGSLGDKGIWRRIIRRRVSSIAFSVVALFATAAVVEPGLLAAVMTRFEGLFNWQPSGSVLYRVVLAERALAAFADHPIFGVGPGGFKYLYELYVTLHLSPAFVETRNFSAHNLLLHYLAETGLIGGMCLIALFANQLRLTWFSWLRLPQQSQATAAALYAWACMFALSTVVEAAWMWGQLSFLAVFFAALVSRQYRQTVQTTGS